MARASTHTLLSLDKYSSILGISPAHFNGATAGNFFPAIGCGEIWRQYAWQSNDRISREDLALAIADAEADIASVLGFWPAPVWTAQEVLKYPQHWRHDIIGSGSMDVRGQDRSIKADWGKVIAPGVRKITWLVTPAVAYTDLDGDGFKETATISFATTLTNECEIKVYFVGHEGDEEWEIRPARHKTITAGGLFIAVFYTWQMIDPDLWEAFPTASGVADVDLTDAASLVVTVEVYKECNDAEEVSAQFFWGTNRPSTSGTCTNCGGSGCEACGFTIQDGCLSIMDPELGLVAPHPGAYNTSTGVWDTAVWTVCRTPDFVKIWYYSGEIDQKWLSGKRCDPLPDVFASAIAWLATARLERPLCACSNVQALAESLQTDLSESVQGKSRFLSQPWSSNPFGTRRGEVKAWQRIRHLSNALISAGVI
jgi:hypothetical protein